jgi:aspartokinase
MRIKGLKISAELSLVRLRQTPPSKRLLPAFCHILAANQINMPFLSTVSRAEGIQVTCCVDASHHALVKQLVDADPLLPGHVSYTPGVGLLTLYPHQSSLKFLGLSLSALTRTDLRVFALGSSIGALTYVLDYARMDKAATVLQSFFKLDENHAPFRAEFVVAQGTQVRSGDPE